MSKLTVYRHDARDFKDGDEMPPAGDHYERLTSDQKSAEDAIRAGHPDGVTIRSGSLYVYADKELAEFDWKLKKDRHLYQLEIDDTDIAHTGDLDAFGEVVTAIRKKEPTEGAVKKYWTPAPVSRRTEILASKAVVMERLKSADEYKSPTQRATEKFRYDPDEDDFFDQILDGKERTPEG
jgi:hypothetical protein